jgi:hypothetical protein
MKLKLPASNTADPVQVTPAVTVLEETYDATISTSTEITLNANTTLIEVAAIDKTILLKWGTDDASTSDFDEVIPLNTVRTFYVPAGVAAVNFIEQAATAILCVCEK